MSKFTQAKNKKNMETRKCEFSKIILAAAMFLYIVTALFGIIMITFNPEYIGELFTFIGAPTAVAIGFYAWKAKAENLKKIDKDKIGDDNDIG